MDRIAHGPGWGTLLAVGLGLAIWLTGPEARPAPTATPADVVLLGGKILTVDAQNRVCSALAIQGERIVPRG